MNHMLNKIVIFFIIIFLNITPGPTLYAVEPDYSDYKRFLDRYVSTDTVEGVPLTWLDYSGIRQAPEFEQLVKSIETYPVDTLANQNEKMSFYINAYNIFAIKMVVYNWHVESIKDAGSWLRPVWDKKVGSINGKSITLGMIEHEKLRPMQDPGIHMAIACASISCPDLRNEPYQANNLQ